MVEFVNRYEPTTQPCSICGNRERISLSEKVFKYSKCGIEIDRDVNSANNILKVGIKQLLEKVEQVKEKGEGKLLKTLPVDSREVTPEERTFVLVETGSSLL